MIKKLMNNLIPAAQMAGKQPAGHAPAKTILQAMENNLLSGGAKAPAMNPHHQLAAQLKSGAVKFNPNQPALPHTATRGWSA